MDRLGILSSLILLFVLLLATTRGVAASSSSPPDALVPLLAEEDVRLEKTSVMTGRTAELPCDISPPSMDSLYLVLWYKNDSDFPIYKYDARRSRESYRQQQQQWQQQITQDVGGSQHGMDGPPNVPRVHFQFDRNPALLLLNNVVDQDEGFYRCRVDFGRSPTRNVLVQLTVVVPPQKIRIIENNREVSSVIGPYDEGSQLSLNCIVSGGRPRPEVSWWLDDQLVDHTFVGTSENVVQNVLVIQRLERRHHSARLRCQASNYFGNSSSGPAHQRHHVITSSVELSLNLRPLSVWISGADKPLSAGKAHQLECTSAGSQPAANIHWYLHSVQQSAKERVSMDGGNTTSVLKLTPTARDHETDIICSAVNPLLSLNSRNNLTSAGVETRKRLNIHFAPIVELELGRNLNPDTIVEGNDVYFECRIRSNPSPSKVTWTHEGQSIKENASAGVIIVESSLVIRRVSRAQSGKYSCTATNVEGTGSSNTVQLRVMYQPVCRPGQKTMYGVAKGETTQVKCNNDAIPPAHSYRWAFNTSAAEMAELQSQPNQLFPDGGGAVTDGSVISYSPQSDRDYGTLLCWARNDIGEQRDPCVYRIFLGVRPDPPSNCSVLNQTADAVEIWCRPGFDGGHPQQFQFEIFDTQSAVLLYNKSGRYPHLRVGNLESGLKLFIQVYAFNLRGRSALVPLDAYTVKIAEKQTVIMETTDLASVLGIVSGVSGSLVMVCIAIGLTARFRHHHRHPQQPSRPPAGQQQPGQSLPGAVAEKQRQEEDIKHRRQHQSGGGEEDTEGEANPDLLLGRREYYENQEASPAGRQLGSTLWNGESRDSLKRPVPPFRMVRAGVGGVTPSVHYYGNGGGIGHQPQSATWNGQHSPIAEVVTVKTPHRQRISVGSIEEDDDPETPI